MANRAQYPDEIKAKVRAKYPLCKTPEDRDALARECGIGSRQKLYNLASRLLATRHHSGTETEWITEDEGYDATRDNTRLFLRDDYDILKDNWTEDEDRYMIEHFGKTPIESIAFMLNRTETAVSYRVRQLGLRSIPKYYDAAKVTPWLGISNRDLIFLKKKGLELFPCTDKHGKMKIILVSTTSLARVLLQDRLWKELIDHWDADEFFIRDIVESVSALQKEEAIWEPNLWVSHGHTCLNPFSDTCFGLFYDGHDEKLAGADLDPRSLAPSANIASDNWRRRTNEASDQFEKDIEELSPELKHFPMPEETIDREEFDDSKELEEVV